MNTHPIETSQEINVDQYEEYLHTHPFDVIHMNEFSTSYDSTGTSFSLNSPGYNALLSRDVWVQYTFDILENAAHSITDWFETYGINSIPQTNLKAALRSGNVVARCMQRLNLNLNGVDFNYQPCYYVDVLNRLYVSNEQSSDEFSASGGRFDEGNHGHRTSHVTYLDITPGANQVDDNFGAPFDFGGAVGIVNLPMFTVGNQAADGNSHVDIYLHQGWRIDQGATVNVNQDLVANLRPNYPVMYKFYNPGYDERVNLFAFNLRQTWNLNTVPNAGAGGEFVSTQNAALGANANQTLWRITIYERLPCPLFKMYDNDNVHGVIPNISSIRFNIGFIEHMEDNMFSSSVSHFNNSFDLLWRNMTTKDCIIHSKWYVLQTPLPKEISIKFPIYITQVRPFTMPYTMFDMYNVFNAFYQDIPLQENRIEFPAVPDLLLIFVKYNPTQNTMDTPDAYNSELIDFSFAFNRSNSKCYNMKSIHYYQLWKNNLKYKNAKLIGFEEWYKYCFVICLKPEDYGVKMENEYHLPCQYNITCTARNWFVTPGIMGYRPEYLGGDGGLGTSLVLVSVGIFFRHKVDLSVGSCKNYLQK